MSATVFYATAFLVALSIAWWHIRHRDVSRHREWMLRAVAILLGIATTRPVMGIFFATRALTHLNPSQFFGVAFWIGFTSTLMAAEWYIRATRPLR
jgi:cytochrome bd-type quinol oxidase subunit 1